MSLRIFVSSVQTEFAEERRRLAEYIRSDALLADFFDVFLFEEQPARSRSAKSVFLGEVEKCDVYLGLFGAKYSGGKVSAVSPTEREYDLAKKLGKTMLGFVRTGVKRERREDVFVRTKVDIDLSRNPFANFDELKAAVYKSLVVLLKENDEISNKPFDQSFSRHVKISDLDHEKFQSYLQLVRDAGKVTLPAKISDEEILLRLGALKRGTRKIANGAIPLFARRPEEFMMSWEVRCLQYYGIKTVKPIPSLHTYTGTVFELVDQALDFVMSRVDFAIGERGGATAAAPTKPEFPRDAIQEAIVNAVCHRDYRSHACVQVMLFRDRLEIHNPGSLPPGMSVDDLYRAHESNPRNQLIARAMSWTSYVEKSGSGTGEILAKCAAHGLAAPEFDPAAGTFRTVIWRSGYGPRNLRRGRVGVESQGRVVGMAGASQGLVKGASQGLVEGASRGFLCILESLRGAVEKSSTEIAGSFGKTRANSYIKRLISVMIDDDMLEPTGVRKKGARLQKYRLTVKGRRLVAKLTKG